MRQAHTQPQSPCWPLLLLLLLVIGISNVTSHTQHQHQKQQQQQRREYRSASATSTTTSSTSTTSTSASDWPQSWLGPELTVVRRVYDDCQSQNDFLNCLKQKALHALSRALDQDSIKIVDGLVLERQNRTEPTSIIGSLTDGRTFGSMSLLDRTLLSQLDKLARTHALKVDMVGVGRGHEDDDDDDHHHKKKKDKGGGHIKYVIAALLTAMGIAGPIGLKALAAIAGKALVISKVALTIAGIIALKKLFSHDHHEETSFQVHAGDHNRRSTYVIRPLTKASSTYATGSGVNSASVDPYRYYYEYH